MILSQQCTGNRYALEKPACLPLPAQSSPFIIDHIIAPSFRSIDHVALFPSGYPKAIAPLPVAGTGIYPGSFLTIIITIYSTAVRAGKPAV